MSDFSIPQAHSRVTRHAHLWLGLMLLALHAATAWDISAAWAKPFLLAHFGLFLLWQPLWQGDGRLRPSQALLVIVLGALLATFNSWWLIALWLALLLALIGGSVPSISGSRERTASLLAALYLLALLLLWVVPHLSHQVPGDTVLLAMVRYGLPLLALVLVCVRAGPPRVGISVDIFYSATLFLLVAVLVLGSLLIVHTHHGQYLLALAQTLIIIALALIGLSWLMSPTAGYAGIDQMLSRYLMSVGLPFEQWVHRLAAIAEHESEPQQFLDAALAHLLALPWVIGLRWKTLYGANHHGHLNEHYADFALDDLDLRIHTRWALSPALLLHVRLLAHMIGHFHTAKQREQLQRKSAYTQAIYETGSRLTHDVKNLLQSLHALCAAAQDPTPDQAAAVLALMQRQLPQITQRLNTTLDKLRAPQHGAVRPTAAAWWWRALQQRYVYRNVQLSLTGEAPETGEATVPAELFDSVLDNLIENALRKAAAVHVAFDPAGMTLSVTDSGAAIAKSLAAQLFSAPLPSNVGLGVGLYHAARYAAQHGYRLSLARNQPGDVCFRLAREA